MDYHSEIGSLKAQLSILLDRITLLETENAELRRENKELKAENIELKSEIATLKAQREKTSQNSHKPPSTDTFRKKVQNSRKKSNRSQGGQVGHKGSTLTSFETADIIIGHHLANCVFCGTALEEEGKISDCRQVVDIPVTKMEVTQHEVYENICPFCKESNKASFPEGITQPAQYGSRLKGFISYLSHHQLIPYRRIQELIESLYTHHLSTGSIANFTKSLHLGLEGYEASVKIALLNSSSMHVDETGMRIDQQLAYLHVRSTDKLTYFYAHAKRGRIAMEEEGFLNQYVNTLIHDRLSSYNMYGETHGLCNAHILRDLKYVEELGAEWAAQIATLLVQIKRQKEAKGGNLTDRYRTKCLNKYIKIIRVAKLKCEIAFKQNLPHKARGKPKRTAEHNLLIALDKHKVDILRFMYHFEVPFDNNQAERDLRMQKLRQKISGCFRSMIFAQYHARIKGYISTLKKQGLDVLEYLSKAFQNDPFILNTTGI